jgi:dynein light intermediate chain 1
MRKFCLEYGASLVFTSANSNSNMEMLYSYIVHRIYDQDFAFTSNINDKEALFIPSGRDSKDLIDNSDLR